MIVTRPCSTTVAGWTWLHTSMASSTHSHTVFSSRSASYSTNTARSAKPRSSSVMEVSLAAFSSDDCHALSNVHTFINWCPHRSSHKCTYPGIHTLSLLVVMCKSCFIILHETNSSKPITVCRSVHDCRSLLVWTQNDVIHYTYTFSDSSHTAKEGEVGSPPSLLKLAWTCQGVILAIGGWFTVFFLFFFNLKQWQI